MMAETQIVVNQEVIIPEEQNVQTVVKSEAKPESVWRKISWDIGYFGSTLGKLKIVQLLFGIICMLCATPDHFDGTRFFFFIVVKSFIVSFVWCLIHLLHVREVIKGCFDWKLTELINNCVMTLLYAVATCVQLTIWSNAFVDDKPSVRIYNLTAGAFGLFNTLVYSAVCDLLWEEWQTSRRAQQVNTV